MTKPEIPNATIGSPVQREIIQQDTFSTDAEPEKLYKLTVEFTDDAGKRRKVDLVEPMTEKQAFVEAEQYRQPGEVVLQLIRQSEVKP